MSRPARLAAAAVLAAAAAGVVTAALVPRGAQAYDVLALVADRGLAARVHDAALVNAWGLAASPTGPWWTANEARATSTLYAGDGHKQALTVTVEGGPTGIVYNAGDGFVVRRGRAVGTARFIYACEDGMIRAWSPVVPHGWSSTAEVAVDLAGRGAVLRGLALARLLDGSTRIYATDFHNGRVVVFDERWHEIVSPGAFTDRLIPAWYSPFGIQAVGGHVFVTYGWRAPVNGNDAPTGGYVDEFDLDGALVSRVARMGPLDEPWGVAVAPHGFGSLGGALLVGNFGSGRIDVFARHGSRWAFRGQLQHRDGKPVAVPGLWGIAFGNGGMAGARTILYFAAGPHRWRGDSELSVHGLLGAISPARR
jgi:uncharacterized protein (TIGR03118 family)